MVKFWQVLDAERDDANLDKLMEALDEMGKTKQEDDDLLKSLRERYFNIFQQKTCFEHDFDQKFWFDFGSSFLMCEIGLEIHWRMREREQLVQSSSPTTTSKR